MEDKELLNGWIKLYHPGTGGVQCTLPIPAETLSADQARGLYQSVQNLLSAGFTASTPSLAEGETREAVTHLAQRMKKNPDGSSTAILDVYCGGNWKLLHLYLNTAQEIEGFTRAFELGLSDLPLWEGDTSIERGKNPDRDARYLIPVRGVDVVYRTNPKWEGEDDRKHSKRIFVRWEPQSGTREPVAELPAATRVYADGNRVNGNTAEQQSFDRYLSIQHMQPASRDALRQWVRENAAVSA